MAVLRVWSPDHLRFWKLPAGVHQVRTGFTVSSPFPPVRTSAADGDGGGSACGPLSVGQGAGSKRPVVAVPVTLAVKKVSFYLEMILMK